MTRNLSMLNFEKIQTFLEAMDQRPQLVHREVIIVVVEVEHKLMKYDVVDHHCIKQKEYYIE